MAPLPADGAQNCVPANECVRLFSNIHNPVARIRLSFLMAVYLSVLQIALNLQTKECASSKITQSMSAITLYRPLKVLSVKIFLELRALNDDK